MAENVSKNKLERHGGLTESLHNKKVVLMRKRQILSVGRGLKLLPLRQPPLSSHL